MKHVWRGGAREGGGSRPAEGRTEERLREADRAGQREGDVERTLLAGQVMRKGKVKRKIRGIILVEVRERG